MCKMAVKWCLTNLGHQVGRSGGGGWGYCDQNANVTVMVTGSLTEEAQGTFPKKSSIASVTPASLLDVRYVLPTPS
jgi:hypothetical protein